MVNEEELAETSSSDSEVFRGKVSTHEHKPWTADIIVNEGCVTFKLDFDADVTVFPPSTYYKLINCFCAKPKTSIMVLADMS